MNTHPIASTAFRLKQFRPCYRVTPVGLSKRCPQCTELWPATKEFFHANKGRLHSWCKDCYANHPKQVAKRQRFIATRQARRKAELEAA